MRFEREQCLDLAAALARTWLLTDGAGALAAGTALGCPASRRHGLLVAGGHLLLARLEEWVVEGERALPVSTACYPGTLYPGGHTFLAGFDAWPTPRWLYRVGDVEVTRELCFAPAGGGGHTLLVRWTVKGPAAGSRRLTIRPFLACREAGALTFENPHVDRSVRPLRRGFVARPYPALPPLAVTVSGAPTTFAAQADWYRRIEYPADLRAGLPAHEDHLTPGAFTVEVGAKAEVVLAATTGPAVADPRALWRRRQTLPGGAPTLGACLARAAADHLVRARGGLSVLAHLPEADSSPLATWESLPGLLLARGGLEKLGTALARGARNVEPGDLAAALAWARAVGLYLDRAPRSARRGNLLKASLFALGAALRSRAAALPASDSCGLLWEPSTTGAPRLDVTLNARWYALAHRLAALARGSGRRERGTHQGWAGTTRTVGAAFLERFWLEDAALLADGPGMVAAAAEARSPLTREQRMAVLARARTELLTPRGLRSLSPREPAYRPAGAVSARWVGAYVEASLRAEGPGASNRARLRALVLGFAPHLSEHGLCHVAEAFDGDAPHAPSGAPSDARAVASLRWAAHLLGLGLA